MSSSRYLRPASPPGRRFQDPARASTGSVYKSYEMPSNYTTRETYTSPRSSGDRVVPISKETYVNGRLIESSRDGRSSEASRDTTSSHDSGHHERHHHRRSTYDQDSRAPPSSSAHLRSSNVLHQDRGASADRSHPGVYDDKYITSSSAPRKEHRRLYSVDDGKATRIPTEPELRRRDDRINELKQPPSERSTGYHLRGGSKSSVAEEPAYEYTDPRSMYRDTEPKWRPRERRGSVDGGAHERPSSMVDPYQTAPRLSTRDFRPPPSTRGFDKINSALPSRHGSLQAPYYRSPSRSRGYTTSSTFSDDENYRVPPRISQSRDDSSHYSSRASEVMSPTRAGADDYYYDPRRRSRFEDKEVASRGFGIRAPSADARSSGESGLDKYSGYTAEPLMIEAPPASRRDYPVEPREGLRDDTRSREPDWREQDRIRERDRHVERSSQETSPPRERDVPRDRGKDGTRERDREYLPRDSNTDLLESRRDRDRERSRPEREHERDRNSDEDPRVRNRHPDREQYDDDRSDRDRREHRDEPDHRKHTDNNHHVGEAVAGSAALGAAALGAKGLYDKRSQETRKDGRSERYGETKQSSDARDSRPAPLERRDYDDPSETQRNQDSERERSRRRHDRGAEEEDYNQPRRRNYVDGRDQTQDPGARRDGDTSTKHSEVLDPEEDYRRRVQQVQQEMGRPAAQNECDSDRERRQHDHEDYRYPDRRVEERSAVEYTGERPADTQVSSRSDTYDNQLTESPVDEASDTSEEKRKKRVSIVDPPKEQKQPKSILRKPTNKFPEDPNPIREGVAPLKDAKAAGDKSIPPDARWTKITRSMVNPEALLEKGERFEERQDHVIVLRVLTKEEVQKFADRTKEIRGENACESSKFDRRC